MLFALQITVTKWEGRKKMQMKLYESLGFFKYSIDRLARIFEVEITKTPQSFLFLYDAEYET